MVGLDVDAFIAMVVLELRDQESAEGRLQARKAATNERASNGHVITLPDRSRCRGKSHPRVD